MSALFPLGLPARQALHRKIPAACRKRRLPIPSCGTGLRRLRATTRAFPEGSLTTLVTKKTATRMASFDAGTSSSYQGCVVSPV
jgi:hypothetical protein